MFSKWLKKFKFKSSEKKFVDLKAQLKYFCVEIRVDEKGLIYYPSKLLPFLETDPQGYAEICQTVANIALMEMREKNRILH